MYAGAPTVGVGVTYLASRVSGQRNRRSKESRSLMGGSFAETDEEDEVPKVPLEELLDDMTLGADVDMAGRG